MNVTPNEVLIIALVALVVLGPQRLPEAARQIGKGYRELRKMSTSVRAEIDAALKEPIASITQPIEALKSSINDTVNEVKQAGDNGAKGLGLRPPTQPPGAPTSGGLHPAANSTYRPADELPADELPADEKSEVQTAAEDRDAPPDTGAAR